jgi:hypothetical protein
MGALGETKASISALEPSTAATISASPISTLWTSPSMIEQALPASPLAMAPSKFVKGAPIRRS